MDRIKSRKGIIGFVLQLIEKLMKDEALPFAYQLAYSLLLSIFPFLIFLTTLVGFLNLDPEFIIRNLAKLMPDEASALFTGIIHEVTANQNGTLLSISILTAVWSSAGGLKAFISAMNHVHGLEEDRSLLRVNLDAILMVFGLTLAIALVLLLIVFAQPIIAFLKAHVPDFNIGSISPIFLLTQYFVPMIFLFFLFLAFYMFVPARNVKFRYALPGTVFATVGFMAAAVGFQFYVSTIANYSRFYGAMGAVIILMFWLLLIAVIMVLGGEVNSLLILRKGVLSPFMKSIRDTRNQVKPEAVAKIRDQQNRREPDPERIG